MKSSTPNGVLALIYHTVLKTSNCSVLIYIYIYFNSKGYAKGLSRRLLTEETEENTESDGMKVMLVST